MLRNVLMGVGAGAAGTVALNILTYVDMTVRGRGSSGVPAKVAKGLAGEIGLGGAIGGGQSQDSTAENRWSGLGALFGYVTGLGVGAAYGLIRPALGDVSIPVAGAGLGLTAMAASDLPAIGLGATDPTTWGTSGWLADLVPHLAYGVVTAMAYEAFTGRR